MVVIYYESTRKPRGDTMCCRVEKERASGRGLFSFFFDGGGGEVTELVLRDNNVGDNDAELLFLAFASLADAGATDTDTEWDGSDTGRPDGLVEVSFDGDVLLGNTHVDGSELADSLDGARSALLGTTDGRMGSGWRNYTGGGWVGMMRQIQRRLCDGARRKKSIKRHQGG